MQQVKGVVARAQGRAGRASRRSTSPTPARARRVVQVQACGVCHTDLHYREGGINDDFPFLLGHEAAGRRRGGRRRRHRRRARRLRGPQLARGVRQLPGVRARRAVVLLRHPQRDPEDDARADGTELSPALGIGAFAEKTLVAAGQCTKVDPRRGRRRSACSAAA